VGDLDFLELSVKVDAGDAPVVSDRLRRAVADAGLRPDPAQETKTARVLGLLAG
jgi:hypothetical protein